MKAYSASFILNGITEQDFLTWKHHPVTKLWVRFLKDYGQQLEREQIALLRASSESVDQFKLGSFSGAINAVSEVGDPQFNSIVAFYPTEEEQEE